MEEEKRLAKGLEQTLREAGAALVGFGDLGGICPPPLTTGVSVAVPLPPDVLEGIAEGPTLAYLEAYHALNAKLNAIVTAGAAFLEARGWRARAQTTDAVTQDATCLLYTSPSPRD